MALLLLGMALYGIDLGAVFLGLPWKSSLPDNATTMALEGVTVFLTLGLGALFVAGILALLTGAAGNGEKKEEAPKESEGKA